MIASFVYLVIAMLSIQFGASLAKQLFIDVGAAGTTGLRVFLSAVILLIVANPFKNRNEFKNLFKNKSSMMILFSYGISLGLMNLLFYFSLEKIPLGLAVTLEFLGPLAVSVYFSRKLRDLLWVFFAVVGLCILFAAKENVAINYQGVFYALGAGFFWGSYIVFGKIISRKQYSTLTISSVGMCFAAMIALPAGLFFNGPQMIQSQFWLSGLFIAILSSALPYSLEMKSMQKIPEKTFGILMSFEPVVATVMGFIFLKEILVLSQILAMSLILVACIGSSVDRN